MSDFRTSAPIEKAPVPQFQVPEHSVLQDLAQAAWKMTDNLLTKIPGVKEAEQKLGIGAETAAPVLNAAAAESSKRQDQHAQKQLDLGLSKSIY